MRIWSLLCLFTLLTISACSNDQGSSSGLEAGTSDQSPVKPVTRLDADAEQRLKEEFATTPFKILHMSESIYDQGPALAVTFSVPLDPKSDWQAYVHASRQDGNAVSGEWILGERLNTVYFPFMEADTVYTVEVSSGLAAITGRLLDEGSKRTIRTDRRQRSVDFVGHGTQLSPALSDGLSVEAVNVDSVDVDFLRVRQDRMSDFLERNISGSYYELRDIQTLADLTYSARFDLNHGKDKRLRSVLPVADVPALQEPGLYFAVMKPSGDYPTQYQVTWFSIGDIGFQVRRLNRQLLAFVHHSESARPAAETTIQLYDRTAKLLHEATTDDQGFANFAALTKDPAFAVARKGQHYSVLKLNAPAMDLSEYRLPSRPQEALELFLYSARDLYRPGETVTINGLLRDHDAKLSNGSPIGVRIKTPDNRVYHSFTWQGDEQAWYSHELQLPEQTANGEWRFEATLGNGRTFTYLFNVEDFLPERMKLSLSAEGGRHLPHDLPIEIEVQGDYLYGAPAAGNRVETRVQSRQARTLFKDNWKDFIFGAEDYKDFDLDLNLPGATLDEQGRLPLRLPEQWKQAEQPVRVETEVSLFESGGRPVTRRIQHILWPRETLVGLRPTWDGERATPNGRVELEVIHVDREGELRAAEHLDVLVVREDRQRYWNWRDGWQRNSSRQEIPVYNVVTALDTDERGRISVPVEYGTYRVEVRDRQQNLLTSYRFFAGWRWDNPETGTTGRPDQVTLSWSRDAFAPGTSARLTVDAPYEGRALITVESDRLLWRGQQEVSAGENHIDIPVDANWNRHDVYATVNVIRAGAAKRKQVPKRAFGLIHLPLARDDRELAVTVNAPEKVEPETTLTVSLNVDKANGEPVHLTLAAVDSGVLSLSRFETPQPHRWFFAPRAYQHSIYDTWANFIEQLSDRHARQRFGGDADLARGGEAPQSHVQIVSLFSGKVAVDENGQAQVDLELPYFNGELRLMALAWSDNRFGHQEAKVKVAAPLTAEVSTPRFMARGDKAFATFDVQNLTEENQSLILEANAGPDLGGDRLSERVELAPQQRHTFQLPLLAKRSDGSESIVLSVQQQEAAVGSNSDRLDLEREWRVGLRPPYPAQLTRIDEVLSPGETFNLPAELGADYEANTRQLFTTVSPRPPLNLGEHLEHLFHYPYGCLEQTTSRAWPLLLSRDEDLQRYDSTRDKELSSRRSEVINGAIGRIAGMQRGDGSFGLWNSNGPESHWLTVYATEFLLVAKERGYNVDDEMLKKGLGRLNQYLTTRGKLWSENQHYSSWPDHYHFSYRAYAAMVLASRQQVALGSLRTLFDEHAPAARTRLPLAQIALALERAGDVRRAAKAWQQALEDRERPDGYAGDYGTEVRDLAKTLTLALESRLVKEPLERIMDLRNALIGQRWLSTQERWALYELGLQLDNQTQGSWDLEVAVADEQQSLTRTRDFSRSWRGTDIPATLGLSNPGDRALYLSVKHSGYPLSTPKPVAEGIAVHRTYYDEKGGSVDLSEVTTGDFLLVRVDLSVQGKQRIPDALVVDMLPAGLELENQNLATAVKMDDFLVDGRPVSQWLQKSDIVHREYRDDRYVAAVNLQPYGTTTLFYLARAVTPGEYKVPPTLAEDMYRPWLRAVGEAEDTLVVRPK